MDCMENQELAGSRVPYTPLSEEPSQGKNKVHWLMDVFQGMAFRSNFFFLMKW